MRFCLNGLRASRKRVRALRARVSRLSTYKILSSQKTPKLQFALTTSAP